MSPAPARSRASAGRTSALSSSWTSPRRAKQAIALQGRELLAAGDELDAQPHYRVGDLLGLPVETASGRPVGEVRDVLETPAHEIVAVRAPDGSDVLIPLVDELLSVRDGVLVVVDGLLEEPEAPGAES